MNAKFTILALTLGYVLGVATCLFVSPSENIAALVQYVGVGAQLIACGILVQTVWAHRRV